MKIKTNICCVLMLMVSVVLGGCFSTAGTAINSDFVIPKDSDDGYIAMSVYNDAHRPMELRIDEYNMSWMSYPGTVLLKKSDNIQYILRKFKPGKYMFVGIDTASAFDNLTCSWKNKFIFNVYPRKVTYVGSINLTVAKEQNVTKEFVGFYDESKRDLPEFLRRYKNIPASKYRVGLVKRIL